MRQIFLDEILYCQKFTELHILGQAKLIRSLSSGIFENQMRAGGHFSLFHNLKQCLIPVSIKQ